MGSRPTNKMAIVSKPNTIEFKQIEVPALGADQVLIKVKSSAICGSDLHIYKGRHPYTTLPCTFGHEISGEIVEIGEKVNTCGVGDRVCVEPLITCGECYYCRRGHYDYCVDLKLKYRTGDGGFSDYYIASERWTYVLGKEITFDEGCLMEPLAVAVHAVKRGHIQLRDSVAIFGDGAIGLMILQAVRVAGAYPVCLVGRIGRNLDLAKSMGATDVINSKGVDPVRQILTYTKGLGVDKSFEAVGLNETFDQALSILKKGGRSVIAGIFEKKLLPKDLAFEFVKEKEIIGTSSYCWDFETALDLVQDKYVNLKPLITHKFDLSDLRIALETKIDPEEEAIKVIINP